ncbi:hypothetical protein lbkm_1062 [Lachnospiraceae bacterium KM106-2]|nr:hypothetical protein lbkm_1062 [Lachnospiraceae bacterium KM106-2]
MTAEVMWTEYKRNVPEGTSYEAWAFGGITPESPDLLADLTARGIKTATASAYPFYVVEKCPLPQPGDHSIILNRAGDAVCIIRTTKVTVVPFYDVSAEHAYKEGEGDRSLRFWRECHTEAFRNELTEIHETFSENMLVVCEEFKVVYPNRKG